MKRKRPPLAARYLLPIAALTLLVAALIVGRWVIPIAVVAALALAPALLAWWRRSETGVIGVEEPTPAPRSGD